MKVVHVVLCQIKDGSAHDSWLVPQSFASSETELPRPHGRFWILGISGWKFASSPFLLSAKSASLLASVYFPVFFHNSCYSWACRNYLQIYFWLLDASMYLAECMNSTISPDETVVLYELLRLSVRDWHTTWEWYNAMSCQTASGPISVFCCWSVTIDFSSKYPVAKTFKM